jgi:hypothetical protein
MVFQQITKVAEGRWNPSEKEGFPPHMPKKSERPQYLKIAMKGDHGIISEKIVAVHNAGSLEHLQIPCQDLLSDRGS